MAVSSAKIIKRLEAEGWEEDRVTGSHHHFKKAGERNIVTVTHPRKDFPKGTLRNICRAAEWEWPPDF